MRQRSPGSTTPRRWSVPLLLVLAATVVAACVSLWTPPVSQPYYRTAPVPGAKSVSADECVPCHEDVQGAAPIPTYHADCETCHGPGSLHAESEEPADTRYPSDQDCLTCHASGRTTHVSWSTGQHKRAGLLCSDCHNPHNREPHNLRTAQQVAFRTLGANSSLCVQCHQDVASRLNLPSHHPIREGMLECTDCHSPHEDSRAKLGSRTALCTGCHQDHEGPWVWEHPPSVEDCTTCHNPHGTPSYNLLATAQPAICLSCHSTADARHIKSGEGISTIAQNNPAGTPAGLTPAIGAAFYTRCTDCHGAIHGSHLDEFLRR